MAVGGGGLVIGWPRIKRSLQSHVGGGGQYKMYKRIIFIILVSSSLGSPMAMEAHPGDVEAVLWNRNDLL